ncbi:hypothetical protein E0485_13685 [Paenibacillus albiflavus]|uniref:Uncharacterized protein n=1 Tax=Paenibacillus albiflavus TaxID=2545760 RepID=A0A4R4E9U8_9BACL|nr:DUF6526 family protein [Paenibacillus albiflavus]TCZ76636.1 hypothetical protein E0485_13685 [Paenibacillus albiflavus]
MSNLKPQNYDNHRQFTPLYHYVLALIAPVILIASVVHMIIEGFSFASILLTGISLCIMILTVLIRLFAAKLQDRIIRQEETYRHMNLTGKPLDSRLSLKQIIALRFADDEAYPALCVKAAETGMEPDKIKRSIKNWRADHFRV